MSPGRMSYLRIAAVFAFVLAGAGASSAQSGAAAMSAVVYKSPT